MIRLPLSGAFAHIAVLIDEEDYDLVAQYRWYRSVRKNVIYARRLFKHESKWCPQYMHSLITGWPIVDHIDHDGLNNMRSNLRPATKGQNVRNARAHTRGASPYKGVSRTRKRWKSQITFEGEHYHLGHYDTQIEAAHAYDSAARELFGEFAFLNFRDPA